jgi:quercetin dioxygenase-like cupin family protein
MRRRSILAVVALILALAIPAAVAADDPPAPVARYTLREPGLPAPGPMEVVNFLFEYPPGAATPAHTHPGLVVSFVIEGEVTFETGGKTTVKKPGDTIIERPGEVGVARNATNAVARSVVSMVIPAGAPPSTPQPGAPVPPVARVARYVFRQSATIPAGEYEVVQQVLDFAPGAQTPVHTHPGQVVVTVLEGALTFTTAGATKTYQVGESSIEMPGVVAQARNAGAVRTTTMVAYLLPKGAPLSEPVAPAPPATGTGGTLPGLPSTGGGGATARTSVPAILALVLTSGGALTIGGGLALRRRSRRA